jgi:hypothetical protein
VPLGRLAERMRHTSAMAELAERLRRWHLLLPAGSRPPVWPRIAMLAGGGGVRGGGVDLVPGP